MPSKKLKPHAINKDNNFIAGWYLKDTSICDKIIEYHTNSTNKCPGYTTNGVDKKRKDSIDTFLGGELLSQYGEHLQLVTTEYIKKYPNCNIYSPWGVAARVIVQHYLPNGGYFEAHAERTGATGAQATRHLVFMTYLNDVTDAGETEFVHQELKIKPEKGLTLIWPVDWTFTHHGITSKTQDKYITTGWYNFLR